MIAGSGLRAGGSGVRTQPLSLDLDPEERRLLDRRWALGLVERWAAGLEEVTQEQDVSQQPSTKFFVIGFPKSGTTTLQRAFRRAGLTSAHWGTPMGLCGYLIYQDYRAGRNPLHQLRRYECITQADVTSPDVHRDGEPLVFWPQLDFELLDAIERRNPDVKFILNRRHVPDIIRSINGWYDMRTRLTQAEIIGLPAGRGRTDEELRQWIEGHYRACEERFAGSPKFLDFRIEDPKARSRLERFTGVRLPWWGISNPNLPAEADHPLATSPPSS